MKNTVFSIILIVLFPLFFCACEKISNESTGGVELYLLESYETTGQSCEIELASVVLDSAPLIRYPDFKSYDSKEYVFKITNSAKEAIEALEYPVNGVPFAITADGEVVYTGYFWPPYSSLICQWTVIDPLMIWGESDELHVVLGYPGPMEDSVIPDERNNEKILEIFRKDGKLIE